MKRTVDTLMAAALGAAAMYYFDPEMGRRRRTMLRDQMASRRNDATGYIRQQVRRTSDQVRGLAAGARAAGAGPRQEPMDDLQLAERVRATMGRLVSTPGAVDVSVAGGNVMLAGRVLQAERDALVPAIAEMDGVQRVSDQLEVYQEPGNVPELQGAGRPG